MISIPRVILEQVIKVLEGYYDCGPAGMEYQSQELQDLIAVVLRYLK